MDDEVRRRLDELEARCSTLERGVITLIFGVGFAFKTAVDNNWIGPSARIALGIAAGLATLVGGDMLWRRGQGEFARGLTALGISILYLSAWAAFALYAVVPQEVAFAMMVATTIASVALALRYTAQTIAVLAMIGGYLTPLVLATGEPHALIYLAYVALVNASGFELARRRGWAGVEYVATIATVALFGGWLVASALPGDRGLATVFTLVYYGQLASARRAAPWFIAQPLASLAIAALWPVGQVLPLLLVLAAAGLAVAAVRRSREAPLVTAVCFWGAYACWAATRRAAPELELLGLAVAFAGFVAWIVAHRLRGRALTVPDLALLGSNAGACFAASYHLVAAPYLGGLTVAIAIVQFALARVLWDARDQRPGTLALGIGFAFFTLAVPIQLAGVTITVVWALEGACIAWLAARFSSTRLEIAACGALLIAAAHLIGDAHAARHAELAVVANPRCLAFAVTAATLFATARLLRRKPHYVLGHVVALVGIGLEVDTWARHAAAGTFTVALSIAVALYPVVLVVLGVVRRTAIDRALGLGLLGLVVAKLYVHDVWELARSLRIAAFLALGVVLLTVSYVYSRRSDRS